MSHFFRNITLRVLAAIALTACSTAGMAAGEVDSTSNEKPLRPVASIFSADVGHASILDTYVSPVTYKGTAWRLGWEAQQAMGFNPHNWVRRLELGLDYYHTHNPAGNHTMHQLMLDANWAMMHRWHNVWTRDLQLMVGGQTQLRGGAIYNANNSNNVANAHIHWNLGITAQAVYNTRIKRLPVTLTYRASLPVVGVFFSPDYDEAYYEIYLGNHRNLAHMGWWGNRFDMTNMLSADLHLGGTILRVGYSNRIETSWVNNLNNRAMTHALVIGLGGEFLSLSHKQRKNNNTTISSIY